MPELPEVETVVRTLEQQIGQATIREVSILYSKIIEGDAEEFAKECRGEVFTRFLRRGKYLLLELEKKTLVVHLRMEGKFFVHRKTVVPNKHTHVIFYLDNGSELHFQDVRKFGRLSLIEKNDPYSSFHGLGVEPLSEDMSLAYLMTYAKGVRKPIKELLLDQRFIAGIGNIYADETLYLARIHPLTPAGYLSAGEWERLRLAIVKELRSAIEAGGSTIRSYTSSLGVSGLFQFQLHAYGKKGEKCERCGTEIKRIVVGGRGTCFCPVCQKRKIRIAITGGIASGKSCVSSYLRDKGCRVFDCDASNARLLGKRETLRELKKYFPEAFEKGELCKKKLSERVFHNRKDRNVLEKIMHPLIWDDFLKEAGENTPVFAEVPLLYEAKWDRYFDTKIVVFSRQDTRLRRLLMKGWSRHDALLRIKAQMPLREKAKRADAVFVNDGKPEELYRQIEEWLIRYDWE